VIGWQLGAKPCYALRPKYQGLSLVTRRYTTVSAGMSKVGIIPTPMTAPALNPVSESVSRPIRIATQSMDSDPFSLSLTRFRPPQPSSHGNAGAVVVLPKHSVARLSLGPGRLANHLLTIGEEGLVKFVGYVGDRLKYGPVHAARQIVDAFAKYDDAGVSLLDDVYDEVHGDPPKDRAGVRDLEDSCSALARYTLP
jgi:hypothetical protein